MPICQKCGAYYSEISCPFCTPDDSPDSPVSTIEKEESKTVRIIDPLELVESIEDIESQIKKLSEEKQLEIQKLTEDVAKQEETERKIKPELDGLNSAVLELEGSQKEKQEELQRLTQGNKEITEEIESLKSKFSKLKGELSSKEAEISQLKEELGEM